MSLKSETIIKTVCRCYYENHGYRKLEGGRMTKKIVFLFLEADEIVRLD